MPITLESGHKTGRNAAGTDAFQLLAREIKIGLRLFRSKLSNCVIRLEKKFSIRSNLAKRDDSLGQETSARLRTWGNSWRAAFADLMRLEKCLVVLEDGTSMFEQQVFSP